jgi:hypothetical protein
MDYEVIFYVLGSVLAASAVVFTILGLRVAGFPGRAAPIVFLWFALLVGSTTTFAVLNSKHEEEHREQETGLPQATQEAEEEEAQ